MATPISVVINTLNEERNLPFALASVRPWADDLVVVDMHSDDRTRELAEAQGARVFLHERMGFADPARKFAVAQAKHEWVLVLDADELVPRELSREIDAIVREDRWDAVRLPRLNYLLGAPIHHMGWAPQIDTQLRLFKRSKVEITSTIHNFFNPLPDARRHTLQWREGLGLVHFNYVNLQHFIDKLNRYASIEAKQAQARGEHSSTGRALWRGAREILSRYVKNGGYREGWRGFYLATMMAMYRVAMFGMLKELETGNDEASVLRRYEEIARQYISEYDGGASR